MENDSDPDEVDEDFGFIDLGSDDDEDYDFSDNEDSIAKRSKLPLVEDETAK
jgi:hypothetical protein